MKLFRLAAVMTAFSISLLALPATAGQEAPKSGDARYEVGAPPAYAMVADLVIARPLLIAGTVLGAGLFVVTLPFTAPVGAADHTAKSFVSEPAKAAFARCLGCTETGRYQGE